MIELLYPQFLILFVPLWALWRRAAHEKRLLIVLTLAIAALSRPVLPEKMQESKHAGINVAVALDLSWSMRATDIKPSRLEAAKATIRALFAKERADRFALYGFTTNALILSPPTSDTALLNAALDAIDVDNILTHGTSLAHLFETLAKHPYPFQTVVLFTDGGDEPLSETVVKPLRKSGMKLIVVATATKKGTILHDRYGKALKTASGALIVTRLNGQLHKLAKESGGIYLTYVDPETTADAIADAIGKIAQTQTFSRKSLSYTELYRWLLLPALLLFFFHFVRLPKKVMVLLPFLASGADAGIMDWWHFKEAKQAYIAGDFKTAEHALSQVSYETIQLAFDRALVYYRMGEYRKALQILRKLRTRERDLKFAILFLEGNAWTKRRAYDKARDAYSRALTLRYDEAVYENLQKILTKKSQKERKPPVFKQKQSDKTGFASENKKSKNAGENQGKGRVKGKKRVLGYKAYELINKGYIHEKKPW